jgi:hypothetical protein
MAYTTIDARLAELLERRDRARTEACMYCGGLAWSNRHGVCRVCWKRICAISDQAVREGAMIALRVLRQPRQRSVR